MPTSTTAAASNNASDAVAAITNRLTNAMHADSIANTKVNDKYKGMYKRYCKFVDSQENLRTLREGDHAGQYIFQAAVDQFFLIVVSKMTAESTYVGTFRYAIQAYVDRGHLSPLEESIDVSKKSTVVHTV